MKATLLLCDDAQVSGGKLTAVGAGWTFTSPVTTHAVLGLRFGTRTA